MAKKPNSNAPTSSQILRSITERIVRLEEEKKGLSDDIKEIYAEARSNGFDPKSVRNVVRDMLKTEPQRAAARETEAITDVYRAALGLLEGRPMNDDARRRFDPPAPSPSAGDSEPESGDTEGAEADAPDGAGKHSEEPDKPREDTVDEARQKGREAFPAGAKITANPYPASTAQRAAWDEGFCEASGSDGMDLPAAWRRSDQGKKGGDA